MYKDKYIRTCIYRYIEIYKHKLIGICLYMLLFISVSIRLDN